jgi:flagellar hook-length control protein FliK
MTNLPITSNNSQSPAMATPGGAPLSRNDPATSPGDTASTSQKNVAANDQAAEDFAVLLARQIGEVGFATLNTTEFAAAINGKVKAAADDANLTAKDAQDQPTTAANTSSDPAGSLAAMLLQIPVQQTVAPSSSSLVGHSLQPQGMPSADRELSSSTPLTRGTGGLKQSAEDNLQSSGRSTGTDSAPSTTTNTDSLSTPFASNAIKHIAMAVSSTAQPQTGQSNTKAVMPEAVPSMTHNIQTSDIPAEIQQAIATPLGSSGWADEFSQKIVWMNTQQNQIAELHLNPPDLGPLNVVLKISDNQLTAQFTSPHSAVRDAVENALPKLREILADNNISLGNATVSDQAPHDRGAEAFLNQGAGTAAQRDASFNAIKSNDLSTVVTQNVPARRHNGILDTFA